MNLTVTASNNNVTAVESDMLVVFVTKNFELSPSAYLVEQASPGLITDRIQAGDLADKQGQYLSLYNPAGLAAKCLVVVYCEQLALSSESFFEFSTTLAKICDALNKPNVCLTLADLSVENHASAWVYERVAESLVDNQYRFSNFKDETQRTHLENVTYLVPTDLDLTSVQTALDKGVAIGQGKNFAKNLGNMPPNICNPTYLAKQAEKLAVEHEQLSVTVLNGKDMAEKGMNAFLAVGQGSIQPSKCIILEYHGASSNEKPYALVGKGITFDTGGISIKPAAKMDLMKFDMCGAASVFGVLKSVVKLQLPINLVCVIAAAENMPSSNATRPGDIVSTMSGKTVEILNTDAEGRLVLCDALTLVQEYKPRAIVDIATLTGACVVALGSHAAGLFSNDEQLAANLLKSGENTGDRAWQMPLWPAYKKQLESPFADLANIGTPGGGSITAACFLSDFVDNIPWAHLDIAGVANTEGKEKSATGKPVSLLVDYLFTEAAS